MVPLPLIILVLIFLVPVSFQFDPAIQTELDNLKSSQPSDRGKAAFHLGLTRAKAPEVVKALAGLLQDPDDSVRLEASVAMLRLDQSQPREPIAVLTKLLRDGKKTIPLEVLLRCRDLEPASKPVVEAALQLAQENHSALATFGLLLLDNLGPSARDGASLLEAALKTASQPVRLRVASGLVKIDPRFLSQGLSVLQAGVRQGDAANRYLAARLLLTLDPGQEEARKHIQTELTNNDADRRRDAIEILGSMGRAAVGANEDLRKRLKDEEPEVAQAAGEALFRIFPEESRQLLPILVRLRDTDGRQGSAKMLALIDQLYELTDDSNPAEAVRMMAEQIRRPAKNTSEQLRRLDALTRLVQLGPKASPARLDLIRALDDPSILIRSQVLYVLNKIGPDKANSRTMAMAIERLEKIAKDPGQPNDIRKAASQVLQSYREGK